MSIELKRIGWTNGASPYISDTNLKKMENNTEEAINEATNNLKVALTTDSEIEENTDYEIPLYYEVGADVLDVYYEGEKLVKDIHYIEVGTTGDISNIIQFYDWGQSVPSGSVLEFIVRGTYEESEE